MISTHKESRSEENREFPEQTYLHFASEALLIDNNSLKRETARDAILGRVLGYIRDGWPQDIEIKDIKPYFHRQKELYEELGCVMWGHRVVVSSSCREKVLAELHEAHMGITKTKQFARSYVWWPGIDEAVEAVCRACSVCARVADAPERHEPRPWLWPERPWSRLHLDFLGPIGGATYLVTVDAHSKWVEVTAMSSISAKNVISKLREMWARFGLPRQIVSDNGPPFTSQEFQLFLKDNGIEHIFSASYHPVSNGAAENAVRMSKRVIKKALVQGVNIDIALNRFLLVYRNTEHCTTGVSPAKLLQGRSLRTRLDCLKPELGPRVRREQARQARAAGGSRRKFAPGDRVWYRDYRNSVVKWLKGEVHSRLGETDYYILGADKVFIHRHVDQIRPRSGEPDREGEDRDVSEGGRGSLSRSYLVYPNGSSPVVEEEASSSGREAAAGSAPAATPPRPPPAPQPAPAAPSPARERPNPPRTRRAPRRYGFDFD
ncbi:unnamed protein product [Parnassius mnemosyne]|uniref:RNA-directed DNA polymerase n=1 Tax=Parnassius mnemosyne TaxID=213953 RepID=A0AAV1LNP0_9NEOP